MLLGHPKLIPFKWDFQSAIENTMSVAFFLFQNAMNGGIASMAAEAAAKAQNSPALQRAAAAEANTEVPSTKIREVEVEVAIDPPVSNGHIAQV